MTNANLINKLKNYDINKEQSDKKPIWSVTII